MNWYGDYIEDSAMLGEEFAEAKRFPHEDPRARFARVFDAPRDPFEREKRMGFAALIDCIIDGRGYCLIADRQWRGASWEGATS